MLMMDETSSSSSRRRKLVQDRISDIPDELLVSIVSKLSIKRAARTSILSHRWEKLWICYHGNLEFDIRGKLRNVAESDWPQIKHDFLKSMNRVLRPLLLGSSSVSLNSLIFRLPYLKADQIVYEFEFDTLFEFIMAKRIRKLEFSMHWRATVNYLFSFPVKFYGWIKQPRGLHNISALTSLSFTMVSLSDDTVEYFVSNCPLLEHLCVQLSDLLSNLRIISLKLKYLRILDISGMKSLAVSAPNLVSLDLEGILQEVKLDVSSVPKLVELCIGGDIMTYMSGSLSTYLAQICTLKLYFVASDLKGMNLSLLTPPNNVVFSKLKHLVLRTIITKDSHSLLRFTSSLVEASPMLEKFTLEPMTFVSEDQIGVHIMTTTPNTKQCSQNQRLKVVELTRFKGVTPEVELLVYFVQNFTSSLEQIIIDTKFKWETLDEVSRQARKERGRQLKMHIPPGVRLVLI